MTVTCPSLPWERGGGQLDQFIHLGSGGSRGGAFEPPFEPKLFHFHGEFQEKIGQTAQIEPPQLIRSAPDLID